MSTATPTFSLDAQPEVFFSTAATNDACCILARATSC